MISRQYVDDVLINRCKGRRACAMLRRALWRAGVPNTGVTNLCSRERAHVATSPRPCRGLLQLGDQRAEGGVFGPSRQLPTAIRGTCLLPPSLTLEAGRPQGEEGGPQCRQAVLSPDPPMILVGFGCDGVRAERPGQQGPRTDPTIACDIKPGQRDSPRSSVAGAKFSEFPCFLGKSACNRTPVRVVYDHGCRGSGPA